VALNQSIANAKERQNKTVTEMKNVAPDFATLYTAAIGPWEYTNAFEVIVQLNSSNESNGCQPFQQNRIYYVNGKNPALTSQLSCGSNAIEIKNKILGLFSRLDKSFFPTVITSPLDWDVVKT
jgi:hypothetical protein